MAADRQRKICAWLRAWPVASQRNPLASTKARIGFKRLVNFGSGPLLANQITIGDGSCAKRLRKASLSPQPD